MARQWRIEYPNALYHVMSRGNGGQHIYLTDQDRYLFLELLAELPERFNIEVHAYVLMGFTGVKSLLLTNRSTL